MKKYREYAEIWKDGERIARKTKTHYSDLKGRDLKRHRELIRDELYRELEKEIDDPEKLIKYNFKEFSEYYIENALTDPSTIDYYRKYLRNRTIAYFGKMKLVDIKAVHTVDFFNKLKKTISPLTGKKLSKKTIEHYQTVLKAIFNYAILRDVIKENPMDKVIIDMPKPDITDKYYTPVELKEVLTKMEKYALPHHYLTFILTLQHALRPGEVAGLQWSKIRGNQIRIDQAISKTSKGYRLKPTKTEDQRTETLTNYEMYLLNIYKQNEIKKHGKTDIENKYIITNEKGEFIKEGVFRKYFKNFCKKHNLRYIVPYGLRHTSATLLAMSNIPVINISKKLGHTNTDTTQVYIHAVDDINEKMTEVLDSMITPKRFHKK